ncbi:hypothetical protein TIFTF001_026124 [Ficus carica]|uniref:Uncharacterized protein n=1 Tax=Ficus carica TaxID=3494 RepID=A0AA88AZG0_FICCA|nr:hypothetical protein TIFTF001_026124 [Ficus carica]
MESRLEDDLGIESRSEDNLAVDPKLARKITGIGRKFVGKLQLFLLVSIDIGSLSSSL